MRYLCCDPRYPEGTPPDKLLTKTFYGGVRFVVFPELWPYVGHCLELGLNVALVVAQESGDPAQYTDWASADWMAPKVDWFVGNEPDGTGDASWTMTPAHYAELWAACKVLHGRRWIAGMCSGQVDKAREYLHPDAAGLSIHIYTLSPSEAAGKVLQYRDLGKRLWVGETHAAEGYKLANYGWTTNVNDYCYSDAMNPGFGLFA